MLSLEEAQSRAQDLVTAARKAGADAADAIYACNASTTVAVRLGALEDVERSEGEEIGLRVFIGQRSASISASDMNPATLATLIDRSIAMAREAPEDPYAGLAPEDRLLRKRAPSLDLVDEEEPEPAALRERALIAEEAARSNPGITNSEGAGVSAQQSHFFSAHTNGFRGGYASSRHSLSVAPIASLPGRNGEMQRDAWYSSMRNAADLASPEAVGRYAAQRALSRLGSRKIPTTECPVLFESTLAAGLLGSFVQAVSGGALYRRSTFLLDSLGKPVFPKHIDITEDPFILGGKGSSPFDEEGVRVQARKVVDAGRVEGYFLSSYSARKLGMKTTGNAGGSHNLVMTSRRTKAGDDLPAMLKKLGTGLFVIELMGQGVNYVTGDYSRGVSGFWVENGEVAFPVHEITIAGNLKDMLKGIEAVGADAYNYGAKTVGSILINRMKVAGS